MQRYMMTQIHLVDELLKTRPIDSVQNLRPGEEHPIRTIYNKQMKCQLMPRSCIKGKESEMWLQGKDNKQNRQ